MKEAEKREGKRENTFRGCWQLAEDTSEVDAIDDSINAIKVRDRGTGQRNPAADSLAVVRSGSRDSPSSRPANESCGARIQHTRARSSIIGTWPTISRTILLGR